MTRVYSDLKILPFLDRARVEPDERLRAPVHVRIKPINHCNHSCWFCAYRADSLSLGDEMDLKSRIPEPKMFEIASDMVRMGVRAVTFSGGGEPLLYKALPEIVETLAAGGVRVAAITNGSNLQGRMAAAFAEWGSWIRVSADAGDDATYSSTRGLKPETRPFSRLLDNLSGFSARRSRCVLGVSFIIHEQSAPQIYDACRQFRDAGVRHIKLSGAVVGNGARENKSYHDRLASVAMPQIQRAMELATDSFTVVDHYHALTENFSKSYRTCPMATLLTVIGADCEIYACQDKAYTTHGRLGSIRERSFADFWYSKERQDAIAAINPSETCRHHCVSHRKNMLIDEYLSIDPDHMAFV